MRERLGGLVPVTPRPRPAPDLGGDHRLHARTTCRSWGPALDADGRADRRRHGRLAGRSRDDVGPGRRAGRRRPRRARRDRTSSTSRTSVSTASTPTGRSRLASDPIALPFPVSADDDEARPAPAEGPFAVCAPLVQIGVVPSQRRWIVGQGREDRALGDSFFSGCGSDPVRRARVDGSPRVQGLRARPARPRQADGGPPPHRRLPLALVQLARLGHLRRGHLRPAVARARGVDPMDARPGEDRRRPSSSSTSSASRSSASTTATSRRRARPSPSRRPTSTAIVDEAERHQARTGVKLLWGTANLFSHPRYAAGAATNPDPEVFAYAAAQVKTMLEVTQRLGGANYVLWGGREGYETLLNTDLAREEAPARPVPDAGRRAQAPDRLRGHAPHRAEAAGADQAPVRLRRARPSTASWCATGSSDEYQRQHRGQPRDAGRPQLPPRGGVRHRQRHLRQHRRQPRRLPERLGHRPVPELGRGAVAGAATRSCAPAASRTGGFNFDAKLRRQSMDRTGPVPRPHRRHRHARPVAPGRRRHGRAAGRSTPARGALRGLGGRARARRSWPVETSLEALAGAGRRRRDRPATRSRAGRSCSRTWSTSTSGRPIGGSASRPAPGAEPMALVLGIDVSTTATKAVLIDEAGAVARDRRLGVRLRACRRPLWSEQDPGSVVGRGGRRDRGGRWRRPGRPAPTSPRSG